MFMYDIQLIIRSYSGIQNYLGYPGCNKYRDIQLNLSWSVNPLVNMAMFRFIIYVRQSMGPSIGQI